MGYFNSQIITDAGVAMLAKMTAGDGEIVFTELHTGTGEYDIKELSGLVSRRELKAERQIFPVNDIDSREKNVRVGTVISNNNLTEGYYIREIGLFARMGDSEEVLFAISICNDYPTFLPAMEDVPIELPVTNYISYSGDGNFTINYRSDVYATLEMVKRISAECKNVQVDWDELDDSEDSFIKNKPDYNTAIDTAVTGHNSSTNAHNDIRELLSSLSARLSALADSDDSTLDQLSEIVSYIKNNKSLIDGITTSKVSVSDIVNNCNSNAWNKPLSANQGHILNTKIENAVDDLDIKIPLSGSSNITGSLIPSKDAAINLGEAGHRWRDCYVELLSATNIVGDLTGNATTATKATKDGNGNVITSTYWNKTRDFLTTKIITLNSMTLQGYWDGSTTGTITAISYYKAIAVIPTNSNASDVSWMQCSFSSSTITAKLKNGTETTKTFSPTVTVLYLRTS